MPLLRIERARSATDPGPPASLITAAALAVAIGAEDDIPAAERLAEVGTAMVNRYAPEAPEVLRREAAIRVAGYFWASEYGGIRKDEIGPQSVEYTVNHAAVFRNCGAAALLTNWRVRRAGLIA